jgi:hypothetical protein
MYRCDRAEARARLYGICTPGAPACTEPVRAQTHAVGMDIIAILLLVATFASLAGLIELLDRV